MYLAAGFVLALVLVGHLAIWCAIYNQLHATSWPRPSRKVIEKVIYAIVVAIGFLIIRQVLVGGLPTSEGFIQPTLLAFYGALCLAAAAAATVWWLVRKLTEKAPRNLVDHQQTQHDLQPQFARPPVHGLQARLLSMIPGNEIFRPVIEHRSIVLRGWPSASDGLRIVQLSDLHFTGKVGIEYFQEIVALCNQVEPDFVVLTGDILDKTRCLSWLEKVLGSIDSKLGRFYVLGNHDRRIADTSGLRSAIEATGFESLNGRWHRVAIPGGSLWFCGNELPWYFGADSLPHDPPRELDAPRILIAHSPDQYRWGLDRKIDLMLAGHCHGGQIRLPFVGAIVSPSRYGVRFASGAFAFDEMTMVVSRGVSADDPIRLNCPPEISLVELRSGAKMTG